MFLSRPVIRALRRFGRFFLEVSRVRRALDLAAHPVQSLIHDRIAGEGVGANVLGDPRIALTWLVNELSHHSLTLMAGEVVTTGTCLKPVVIAPGDRLRGDFGPLGQVSIAIS